LLSWTCLLKLKLQKSLSGAESTQPAGRMYVSHLKTFFNKTAHLSGPPTEIELSDNLLSAEMLGTYHTRLE